MRALVTGSAGFIGRHMVRELKARGWIVDDVDIVQDDWKLPSNGSWETTADDLLSFLWLDTPVYDLVVHAAYHVGGRAAIDGVNTNFAKNLQLDASLFEWAVRTKQKRVLYFSSSAAYPIHWQERCDCSRSCMMHRNRLRESMIDHTDYVHGNPDANYGWAKLTGERLAEDARKSGLAVTVVRPASGCGSDQSEDYPFVALAKRVVAKETPLTIWGGEQYRDFIDVSDVVKGALAVVESGTTDPVNIASGRATSFTELAQMMWREAHGSLDGLDVQFDASKPMGVYYRVLDPTRFNEHYTPSVSLEEMVRNVVSKFRG